MLLLRGATLPPQIRAVHMLVSIHAPLARSNSSETSETFRTYCFNTCSSCEEQLRFPCASSTSQYVSIHAPLARSNVHLHYLTRRQTVSIHAPLARSNFKHPGQRFWHEVSIHAPLARSNFPGGASGGSRGVSIHAPLARSNFSFKGIYFYCHSFNTCSSCEEQLLFYNDLFKKFRVSIHAPLARSNDTDERGCDGRNRFNTCSSCEEQLFSKSGSLPVNWFQYMLLLRGATGVI